MAIVVPPGHYAPEFVSRPEPQASEEKTPVDAPPAEPFVAVNRPWGKLLPIDRRWLSGAVMLTVLAAAIYAVRLSRSPVAPAPAPAGALPLSLESDQGIRILAGGRSSPYIDRAGRTWLTDRYFQGGTTFQRPGREILRTPDPEIFQSGREGQFVYEIPLAPGVYELRLYYAETGVASEGLRGVNLAINGIPHSTLDVASDACARRRRHRENLYRHLARPRRLVRDPHFFRQRSQLCQRPGNRPRHPGQNAAAALYRPRQRLPGSSGPRLAAGDRRGRRPALGPHRTH